MILKRMVLLSSPDGGALVRLIAGGRPRREPVVQYGPFVMNTKAEVAQAFEDFSAGRLGTVPPNGLHPHRPTHPYRATEVTR